MAKKFIYIKSLGLGGAERVITRLFTHKAFNDVELVLSSSNKHYDVNSSVTLISSFYSRISFFQNLNKYDLVQAHLNSAILWSLLFNLFFKYQVQVVHCFAYSSYYQRKGFLGKLHRLLFSITLKRASLHIFKAEEMLTDFERVFGWRPKNYNIIYNPYDLANIREAASEFDDNLIDALKTQANIAIMGRLSQSKRPFDILQIALALPQYNFHFIGDGDLKPQLLKKVDALNLKNVVFHGALKNPFPLVKACGFYLSTSEAEGFPNALVEALIVGAICIHSDCLTGPKEILNGSPENVNFNESGYFKAPLGLLFKTTDINGAVAAIKYAVDNRSSISSESSVNVDSFVKAISLNAIAQKYSQCLQGQKDNA